MGSQISYLRILWRINEKIFPKKFICKFKNNDRLEKSITYIYRIK